MNEKIRLMGPTQWKASLRWPRRGRGEVFWVQQGHIWSWRGHQSISEEAPDGRIK